jgi:hypothetical protein
MTDSNVVLLIWKVFFPRPKGLWRQFRELLHQRLGETSTLTSSSKTRLFGLTGSMSKFKLAVQVDLRLITAHQKLDVKRDGR